MENAMEIARANVKATLSAIANSPNSTVLWLRRKDHR